MIHFLLGQHSTKLADGLYMDLFKIGKYNYYYADY